MRRIRWVLLMLVFSIGSAHAELVVVVSAHSSIEHLSRDEVVNIFMGRYRKLPDGSAARPLDLAADVPERRLFYRKLLDKSLDEVNAYWARLVFSGRTTPPAEVKGRELLLERLERDPQAVAYIERSRVSREMRVVLSLPD